MPKTVPAGLKLASRRRRLGAALIDTVVVVPPVIAAFGGVVVLYVRWGRGRGAEPDVLRSFTMSGRWQALVWVAFELARVPARNRRSPGYRALGLRRVDVGTGEALSVRNVVIYDLATLATGQARRRLMQPWLTRQQRRLDALRPELAEVGRAQSGDPSTERQASREVFARHQINPASSCVPAILGVAITQAPVLWSPLNQTPVERLAGILVVQN